MYVYVCVCVCVCIPPPHPPREDIDGQQVYEKMFNFTNHQENANQNHSGIAPHTCQNGCHGESNQ